MTLESRFHGGWKYKCEGVGALVGRFSSAQEPYDETVTVSRRPDDTNVRVELAPDGGRDYRFADFAADVSAEVRRGTAAEDDTYGDYDEMVEEREHVLVELLGSCSGDDITEIDEALDELYSWGDNYDVWLGR